MITYTGSRVNKRPQPGKFTIILLGPTVALQCIKPSGPSTVNREVAFCRPRLPTVTESGAESFSAKARRRPSGGRDWATVTEHQWYPVTLGLCCIVLSP
jgi:hypothetical protein